MNRTGIRAFLAILVILVVFLIALTWGGGDEPQMMDGRKLIASAQAYADSLEADGQPRPESVKVQALVAGGFLDGKEADGFNGMDVTVFLFTRPAKEDDVVVRAVLVDGSSVEMLANGNVFEREAPQPNEGESQAGGETP